MTLRIGTIEVPVPVVLAPMAGITNPAYRRLCREQAEEGAPGIRPAGLFVCEMITSRGIVERIPKTFDMLRFDADDPVKSVQLYGVDPGVIATATSILCGELGIDHVDLNFGCPVPKVTRRGGGGVLPWKRDRLEAILRAVVKAAEPYGVPVTMKTRKGIDEDHLTYLDAGRIAEQSGVAAIALHGRTVAQAYGGDADWESIATLVDAVEHPRPRQRRHLGGRRRGPHDGRDRVRGRRRGSWLPRPPVAVPGPCLRAAPRRRGPTPRRLPSLGEVMTMVQSPRRAARGVVRGAPRAD